MVKKTEATNKGMAAARLLMIMSVFLVLALVGHQMIKRSMKKKVAQKESQSIRATSKKISAEPFRNLLESVEKLLYQQHAPAYRDAEAIQKAVRRLSAELEKKKERYLKKKALRFMYFGENIGTEGSIGYSVPASARGRWIEQWEKIVTEEFLPVDWLKGIRQRQEPKTGRQ